MGWVGVGWGGVGWGRVGWGGLGWGGVGWGGVGYACLVEHLVCDPVADATDDTTLVHQYRLDERSTPPQKPTKKTHRYTCEIWEDWGVTYGAKWVSSEKKT